MRKMKSSQKIYARRERNDSFFLKIVLKQIKGNVLKNI
jgi:hypothetical protein